MSAGGETVFKLWSEDEKSFVEFFAYDDGRLDVVVQRDGQGQEFELDRASALEMAHAIIKSYAALG
jgi:hypothetical protein